MKIINDTLKNKNGQWSRKSLTAFVSFNFAILYELIFPLLKIPTKEYVFITLLTLTASVLGLTVLDKNKNNTE